MFKGDRGETQGDPLPPTIFNVVVYAGVRHWVTVTVEGAEEWSECVQEVRHHNHLFCANDGTVSFSDLRCLWGGFSTLVGLVDREVLWTNVVKTVGMVCRPCQALGN